MSERAACRFRQGECCSLRLSVSSPPLLLQPAGGADSRGLRGRGQAPGAERPRAAAGRGRKRARYGGGWNRWPRVVGRGEGRGEGGGTASTPGQRSPRPP